MYIFKDSQFVNIDLKNIKYFPIFFIKESLSNFLTIMFNKYIKFKYYLVKYIIWLNIFLKNEKIFTQKTEK